MFSNGLLIQYGCFKDIANEQTVLLPLSHKQHYSISTTLEESTWDRTQIIHKTQIISLNTFKLFNKWTTTQSTYLLNGWFITIGD